MGRHMEHSLSAHTVSDDLFCLLAFELEHSENCNAISIKQAVMLDVLVRQVNGIRKRKDGGT